MKYEGRDASRLAWAAVEAVYENYRHFTERALSQDCTVTRLEPHPTLCRQKAHALSPKRRARFKEKACSFIPLSRAPVLRTAARPPSVLPPPSPPLRRYSVMP